MSFPSTGIGLLGGAFDPPHQGHLQLAKQALKQLPIKQVRWIPTANPPHKEACIASFEHRCNMLNQLIDSEPRFLVDTIEQSISGPSFFYRTAELLTKQFPGEPLWLLIGLDQFEKITEWKKADEFLQHVNLAVIDRGDCPAPKDLYEKQKGLLLENYHIEIIWLKSSAVTIASREIRADTPLIDKTLLPICTRQYIAEHELYN